MLREELVDRLPDLRNAVRHWWFLSRAVIEHRVLPASVLECCHHHGNVEIGGSMGRRTNSLCVDLANAEEWFMPRYRFSWNSVPIDLQQKLCAALGLDGNPTDALRLRTADAPKLAFVEKAWPGRVGSPSG